MGILDYVPRGLRGRLLLMVVVGVMLAPLLMLDEVQQWRAGREVRARAGVTCRMRHDGKVCDEAIALHHKDCVEKATYGSSVFDGMRTDVEGYLECALVGAPPKVVAPEIAPAAVQPAAAAPLTFADDAKKKQFDDLGDELRSIDKSLAKLATATDLASIEAQKKVVDASCSELASGDDFLIALAHPDATKLRVASKTACSRERPLAILSVVAAVASKRPAQKKALCALGASALKLLEDAHETSDNAAKDAIGSLGKSCM